MKRTFLVSLPSIFALLVPMLALAADQEQVQPPGRSATLDFESLPLKDPVSEISAGPFTFENFANRKTISIKNQKTAGPLIRGNYLELKPTDGKLEVQLYVPAGFRMLSARYVMPTNSFLDTVCSFYYADGSTEQAGTGVSASSGTILCNSPKGVARAIHLTFKCSREGGPACAPAPDPLKLDDVEVN
jgi:hypothetical protein